MKKNRLFAAVLVLVAAGLVPESAAAQGVSAGLKGGALFSSIPKFGDRLDDEGLGDLFDVGERIGFTGGGFLTLSLLPGFAIQPEVLFVQKGSTLSIAGFDTTLALDYIDIPVLARLSVGGGGAKVYFFGGPSFNFNVSAEADNEGDFEDDLAENIEKSEIGAVVGLGVEIGKFLVEGRWIEGLTNVSKDSDATLRNRAFAVMAGIRF
jgi:hypothetical protein